jgi:hypothetical protein
MIFKKIIIVLLFIGFLSGCAQTTAILGPIYTYGSTGNAFQAGLSFGTNKAITKLTGKVTGEKTKEIKQLYANDIALHKLLKTRIKETRKKLNLIK